MGDGSPTFRGTGLSLIAAASIFFPVAGMQAYAIALHFFTAAASSSSSVGSGTTLTVPRRMPPMYSVTPLAGLLPPGWVGWRFAGPTTPLPFAVISRPPFATRTLVGDHP